MRSLVGELLPRRQPTNESPVPYVGRGRGGLAAAFTTRGAAMDRERQAAAMEGNGSLFAIVGGIAQDVAAVEWGLWRKAPTGKREDREPVTRHAALDVWNNPNPFMSRQEIVETVQQHLDLTGEGWTVFALVGKLLVELWPVYPHRMAPVPDRKKFLAGYVYSSPDGEQVPLGVGEVGLMRQPHPLDVMRGLSAVGALSTDLGTASAARAWNRNFFLNSAEPGGIIEVPRRLTDDEFEEMSARWREQHQGVAAAHRVAIIEGENVRWVDRKYTMRDMQFAELLGVSDEAIRKAYRYPTAMLGTSSDVNRAVAEAQQAIYARNITVPRVERWKGMLNHRFLPAFGPTARDLEFDYVSPVPADAEAEDRHVVAVSQAFNYLIESGVEGSAAMEYLGLPAMAWTKPTSLHGGDPGSGWDEFGNRAAGPAISSQARPRPAAQAAAVDSWQRTVRALTGAGRARNAVEIRAQVDLDGIQDDWTKALDGLIGDWEPVLDAQLEHLGRQVRDAVAAGDLGAATRLQASTGGAEILAAAMDRLAGKAQARAIAEAKAQGVAIADTFRNDVSAWTAAAVAVDGLLSAGLLVAAGREVLRWMGYGRDADDTAEAVTAHLREGSVSVLRGRLGGALTWAQNRARIATFASAPKPPRWYASEANDDRNRCGPCAAVDGVELPTVDAVNLAYGGGGYLFCEGRDRCRGMPVAAWE